MRAGVYLSTDVLYQVGDPEGLEDKGELGGGGVRDFCDGGEFRADVLEDGAWGWGEGGLCVDEERGRGRRCRRMIFTEILNATVFGRLLFCSAQIGGRMIGT